MKYKYEAYRRADIKR